MVLASKCQFLTRPNVLIVLYIDCFSLSGNMKQTFERGYPTLYCSVLLYFILSIASYIVIIIKHILLKFKLLLSCQQFALCCCLPIISIILDASLLVNVS